MVIATEIGFPYNAIHFCGHYPAGNMEVP